MSKSAVPSPAHSQGTAASRRSKARRTHSVTSPARSDTSGKLVSVVAPYINDEKFTLTPLKRRSVLPDDTEIEAPRRASWWKRLEGSSRDVLEALDTNKMPDNLLLEEFEVEVEKEKQSQSVQESSDNESVASIVVPQRRLFNQKKQSQAKFGEIIGSRKSLGKTNLEDNDKTINNVPKNLFNKGQQRSRPVFPAALLNSTNKTINKTVEPEVNERQGRNLFGQAGTKRKKNMFTDFVQSESEDDSEIQHKVFGFKKSDNKRISLATRNRRMPSLTPSTTTEIDLDEWKLLPSSTMIGNGSGAWESNDEGKEQMEVDDQDVTLTEGNQSLKSEENNHNISNRHENHNRTRHNKTTIYDVEIDKTLTNESIEVEQASKNQVNKSKSELSNMNKSQRSNKTTLPQGRNDKTLVKENKTVEPVKIGEQINNINEQTTDVETSIEDKIAKLHGENVDKEKTLVDINPSTDQNRPSNVKETVNENQDDDMEEMVWNDNEGDKASQGESIDKSSKHMHVREESNDGNKSADSKTNEVSQEKEDSREACKQADEGSDDEKDNEDVNNDGDLAEPSENIDEDDNDEDLVEPSENIDEEDVEENEDQDISLENKEVSENVDEDGESEDRDISLKSKEASEDIDEGEEIENQDISHEDKEPSENADEDGENEDHDKLNDEQNDDNSKNNEEPSHVARNKTVPDRSQKIVESTVEEIEIEQDNEVVEGTPDSTYDTTGRNRKRDESQVKSPEAVLQNISKDNMSFKPIGRSTSFRKSGIEDINLRRTLIPIQESTMGSDGSRNSSTEGSGWDSHRTTRKTLRQTFGKDFTPRKSLRALVMEQSAKRQAEVTRNASDMNKTKNKTALEDQHLRDRRVSNRNVTSDQLPHSKSPELEVSTDHVSDPLISKPQVSYHKSVHDINEAEISQETLNREESINMSDRVQNDSGPEISMHASYGSVMSGDTRQEINEITTKKDNRNTTSKSLGIIRPSTRVETDKLEEEELDYDPSIRNSTQSTYKTDESKYNSVHRVSAQKNTETIINEVSEREDSAQTSREKEASEEEISEQEVELEESENELDAEESEQEMEHEESHEDIEPQESEQEIEHEDSQEEIEAQDSEQEVELEESQLEIEAEESQEVIEPEESEQEADSEPEEEAQESEQEMEVDSEHEESQQEQESDQEVSQQEIEDESDHDRSEQNVSQEIEDTSQEQSDQESDRDVSDEPDGEIDSDHESEQLDSRSQRSNRTERIVFDNEMSDQEIDYELSERVSRQMTDHEVSERVSEEEMVEEYSNSNRVSDQDSHDVSVGTKKSMMLIQLEKIAQENMEIRLKIREKVQNAHKQKLDCNKFMSPMQYKLPLRSIKKPEALKTKRKPRKPNQLLTGPLPKEFMEDLAYKPPKRFQPANAPWITKRLYKFLESKLEPKYDYRARLRAEQLVERIYGLTKLARRRDAAPPAAVDELKREMARLHVVTTHFEFYEFFHEFMPREIRVKVNPDVVNKIPKPRNGVFSDILQARPVD